MLIDLLFQLIRSFDLSGAHTHLLLDPINDLLGGTATSVVDIGGPCKELECGVPIHSVPLANLLVLGAIDLGELHLRRTNLFGCLSKLGGQFCAKRINCLIPMPAPWSIEVR